MCLLYLLLVSCPKALGIGENRDLSNRDFRWTPFSVKKNKKKSGKVKILETKKIASENPTGKKNSSKMRVWIILGREKILMICFCKMHFAPFS